MVYEIPEHTWHLRASPSGTTQPSGGATRGKGEREVRKDQEEEERGRERRERKMNGNRIEMIRLGAVMWLWAQQLPAQ